MSKTPEIVISDTSCLIALGNINGIDLLKQLYRRVLITPEIADEFGMFLPAWIEIHEVKNKKKQEAFARNLDSGEASALALSLEFPDCLALLDDLKGRKVAERMNIRYTGVLGILVKSKHQNLIPAVKPLIDQLLATEFRISQKVIVEILKLAGE